MNLKHNSRGVLKGKVRRVVADAKAKKAKAKRAIEEPEDWTDSSEEPVNRKQRIRKKVREALASLTNSQQTKLVPTAVKPKGKSTVVPQQIESIEIVDDQPKKDIFKSRTEKGVVEDSDTQGSINTAATYFKKKGQGSLLIRDILEFSPFNFYHGINPKRLLKGQSSLPKQSLAQYLSCSFCLNITVQGEECDACEQNFCHPCVKAWEASESAFYFKTPCKCKQTTGLKPLNKLKVDYLNAIRFRCTNAKCLYQLTYEELILGTHELDECQWMKVSCEGCGIQITKSEQIRHDTITCDNPRAKCKFCSEEFHLKELQQHMKACTSRAVVKMEYFRNEEEEFDECRGLKQPRPGQDLEFRDYPGQQKGKRFGNTEVTKTKKQLLSEMKKQQNFKDMEESELKHLIRDCFRKKEDEVLGPSKKETQQKQREERLQRRHEKSSEPKKKRLKRSWKPDDIVEIEQKPKKRLKQEEAIPVSSGGSKGQAGTSSAVTPAYILKSIHVSSSGEKQQIESSITEIKPKPSVEAKTSRVLPEYVEEPREEEDEEEDEECQVVSVEYSEKKGSHNSNSFNSSDKLRFTEFTQTQNDWLPKDSLKPDLKASKESSDIMNQLRRDRAQQPSANPQGKLSTKAQDEIIKSVIEQLKQREEKRNLLHEDIVEQVEQQSAAELSMLQEARSNISYRTARTKKLQMSQRSKQN